MRKRNPDPINPAIFFGAGFFVGLFVRFIPLFILLMLLLLSAGAICRCFSR